MGKKKKKKAKRKNMKPNSTKLFIDEMVFRKIMHWCDKAPGEISGMGTVVYKQGIPHVTDTWIFKQKNSGTSTDLDAEELAKFQYQLHKDQTKHDDLWWWHSHKNMQAFWSGTDEDTIHELGSHGRIWATVFNCRREMKSALYMGQPFHVWVPDMPTTVVYDIDENLTKEWDKVYEEKCKVEIPVYSGQPYLGGGYRDNLESQHILGNGWRSAQSWEDSRREVNGGPEKKTCGNTTTSRRGRHSHKYDSRAEEIEMLRQQGFPETDIDSVYGTSDDYLLNDFDYCLDDIQEHCLHMDYETARGDLLALGYEQETIHKAWEFFFGSRLEDDNAASS